MKSNRILLPRRHGRPQNAVKGKVRHIQFNTLKGAAIRKSGDDFPQTDEQQNRETDEVDL